MLSVCMHRLPALWLCWLGVAARPMALLKSPLGHQQPINASHQLGLTSVSTWVDIILKAKKLDSFPQPAEPLKAHKGLQGDFTTTLGKSQLRASV